MPVPFRTAPPYLPLPIEHLEARTLCAAVDSGPDLALTFMTPVVGSFLGGERTRAVVAVHNLLSADVAAPRSTVGLYLSTDHLFDDGDLLLMSAPVRSLKPGSSIRVNIKPFTIPVGLEARDYNVLARADHVDAVNEETETNNTAWSSGVTVLAPFTDLVPVAITRVKLRRLAKITSFWGTATLVVWNVGNVAYSGGITLQGFASRDGTAWPNAHPVSVSASSVVIPPGRSAKIKVGLQAHLAHDVYYAPDFVFTIVLNSPGDPTPGQSVSAIVRFRRR